MAARLRRLSYAVGVHSKFSNLEKILKLPKHPYTVLHDVASVYTNTFCLCHYQKTLIFYIILRCTHTAWHRLYYTILGILYVGNNNAGLVCRACSMLALFVLPSYDNNSICIAP